MYFIFVVPIGKIKEFPSFDHLDHPKISDLKEKIELELHIPFRHQILLHSDGRLCQDKLLLSEISCGHESIPLFLYIQDKKIISCINMSTNQIPDIIAQPLIDYADSDDYLTFIDKVESKYKTMVSQINGISEWIDRMAEECAQLYQAYEAMDTSCSISEKDLNESISESMKLLDDFLREYSILKDSIDDFPNVVDKLKNMPIFSELVHSSLKGPIEHSKSLFDWINNAEFKDGNDFIEYATNIVIDGAQKKESLVKLKEHKINEVASISPADIQVNYVDIGSLLTNERENAKTIYQHITKSMKDISSIRTCEDYSMLKSFEERRCQNERDLILLVDKCKKILSTRKFLEQQVNGTVTKKLFYIEKSVNLRDKLIVFTNDTTYITINLLNQIVSTPHIYSAGIIETIRRISVNNKFQKWTKQVIDEAQIFAQHENDRRKKFYEHLSGNFIIGFFDFLIERFFIDFETQMPSEIGSFFPSLDTDDLKKFENIHCDHPDLHYINEGHIQAQSQTFLNSPAISEEMVNNSTIIEKLKQNYVKNHEIEVNKERTENGSDLSKSKATEDIKFDPQDFDIQSTKLSINRISVNDMVLIHCNERLSRVFTISENIYILDKASLSVVKSYIIQGGLMSNNYNVVGLVSQLRSFIAQKSNKRFGYDSGDVVYMLSVNPQFVDRSHIFDDFTPNELI